MRLNLCDDICVVIVTDKTEEEKDIIMKAFIARIRRMYRKIMVFVTAVNKAVEKYNASGDYNFLDVTNNIKMTEELIKQENTFFLSKRRQMTLVVSVFGILFLYFPQICNYYNNENVHWIYYIISIPYFGLLIASAVCFVFFLWPLEIPQYQSPSIFYKDTLDEYKQDGYDEFEANKGVQYSYLAYLDEFLEKIQTVNVKKGMWHYWTVVMLSITFFFYLLSATYVIFTPNDNKLINNSKIIKIERTKSMMDDKKKFEPSKTKPVHPKVIREGKTVKTAAKKGK